LQADADERHEALLRIGISGTTGIEVPGLASVSESDIEPTASVQSGSHPGWLLDRAGGAAVRQVEPALAEMRAAVLRRHLRDRERVSRYFESLREEMQRQLARRASAPTAEQEARRAKIAALGPELERKLAELAARYSITVRLTPVAALHLVTPVQPVTLRARRRKGERKLVASWCSATRAFDPLGCEACALPCYSFALCDEALHILCSRCEGAWGQAKACPACRSAGRGKSARTPS
jgi:hypothetical protein